MPPAGCWECLQTLAQRVQPDKLKFNYADFHRNFSAGKVVDKNHESRGQKQSRHVEMFATKSDTKSADFVAHSSRTLWQSRRNGIWAIAYVSDL